MSDLMETHVRTFNHGVRTGDWEAMLKHFAPDAELRFGTGRLVLEHERGLVTRLTVVFDE
jgi:hypothetical protein